MKKNPGRASRRRLVKQRRTEDSAKKMAINERRLLHWRSGTGEFKDKGRFLSLLNPDTKEES